MKKKYRFFDPFTGEAPLKGRFITAGSIAIKTLMCKRDKSKSFQNIFLRPRFQKENVGVQDSLWPLLCREPHTSINFPKMWVREKNVKSAIHPQDYSDCHAAEIIYGTAYP